MIFEPVDGGLRLTIDNHSRDVVAHLLGELRHEVEVAKPQRQRHSSRT